MNAYSFEITNERIDNHRLLNVCGPLDSHLRCIERAWDLHIRRRDACFTIQGAKTQVENAQSLLHQLYANADRSFEIDEIQLMIQAIDLKTPKATAIDKELSLVLHTRRQDLQGRTISSTNFGA